ncbi:hypothetical protein OCH239_04285 [Roseivivax halodurans JCM 10272]|uniref:Uncharacterized protein n=1 Tax=Roseivivax halodurans JCM 10272 TaxID=1449350 RepID=X7EEM0_9RHOB|nr:hypothetical protein [Roseivivax halodurans]ETX14310.1 hypothetical protein OCH239_04285 [Roseivivax halodurans JCM 10272]
MTNDEYVFVRITKVLMATPNQARRALTIARALSSENTYHHRDADGAELDILGDDYLLADGTDDFGGAFSDVPSPEMLLGIEELCSTAGRLSAAEVQEHTGRTVDEWIEINSKR